MKNEQLGTVSIIIRWVRVIFRRTNTHSFLPANIIPIFYNERVV